VRRDLALGLSLATLWFIGIWSDLLPFLYISARYPIGALPCWNDFLALVLNVSVLGAGFALLARAVRSMPPRARAVGEWVFLLSLAVPANAVRNHFDTPVERAFATLPPRAALAAGLLALGLGLAIVFRWRARVVRVIETGLLIMVPLVSITFAQAGWAIAQAHGRMQCAPPSALAATIPAMPARRVLWIVYDELEQYATFDARPPGLALPELDRLRAESVTAVSALPPGDRTERSMPAFIAGEPVEDARLVGRNQLVLRTRGRNEPVGWDARNTVFARARALGLNTGVAGFFLPYCSLLAGVVTACEWQPCVTCGRMVGVYGDTVWESMRYQASELAPAYGRRRHLAGYRALQSAALRLGPDRTLGFALLHLPVPHDPPIYDRTGRFSLRTPAGTGYFDNLALVDRSLGELRRAMEANGTWRSTTIVLFGDHGRRAAADHSVIAHPAVPFMVKLAGTHRPLAYEPAFDAVLVYGLTLELLGGRITTPEGVAAWLDANRQRWPVPSHPRAESTAR
jgi:hypothetical protein